MMDTSALWTQAQELLEREAGDGARIYQIPRNGWRLIFPDKSFVDIQPSLCYLKDIRRPRFSIGRENMGLDAVGIRDLLSDRIGVHFYFGKAGQVKVMYYRFSDLTLNYLTWDNKGRKSRVEIAFPREQMDKMLFVIGQKPRRSFIDDDEVFSPKETLGVFLTNCAKENMLCR